MLSIIINDPDNPPHSTQDYVVSPQTILPTKTFLEIFTALSGE